MSRTGNNNSTYPFIAPPSLVHVFPITPSLYSVPMSTSKVIDTLHSQIDALQAQLQETTVSLNECRKKNSILSKRNEDMVEQLSNANHQAEIAQSLLKRKERRVADLEEQLTQTASENDNYAFQLESLKSKLNNYDNEKQRLMAENQRLSHSYNTLSSSFTEFKLQTAESISNLKSQIPAFIKNQTSTLEQNLSTIKAAQPEIDSSYNLLLKNSKRLEQLYAYKYEKVNDSLLLLAESTKQHGQSTGIVMQECEEILKKLNRNEDVLLKIKNQTLGHMSDCEKMKQLNKLRDLSILNDLPSSQSPTPTQSPQPQSPQPNIYSPDAQKRNISVPKKDRRKRNSYRKSLNESDFANLNNNNRDTSHSTLGRSSSTRRNNNRNSRNFTSPSSGIGNGNGNANGNSNNPRKWSSHSTNSNNDQANC